MRYQVLVDTNRALAVDDFELMLETDDVDAAKDRVRVEAAQGVSAIIRDTVSGRLVRWRG